MKDTVERMCHNNGKLRSHFTHVDIVIIILFIGCHFLLPQSFCFLLSMYNINNLMCRFSLRDAIITNRLDSGLHELTFSCNFNTDSDSYPPPPPPPGPGPGPEREEKERRRSRSPHRRRHRSRSRERRRSRSRSRDRDRDRDRRRRSSRERKDRRRSSRR